MAASISFQAEAITSGSSTSRTLSFTVASASGQERLVALSAIANASPGTVTFTSVAIDGQSATLVGSYARSTDGLGNGAVVAFFRANGTANTSINVTCTVSTGAVFDCRGAVWTLNNAGTLLASNTATAAGVNNIGNLALNANTVVDGAAAAYVLAYSVGSGRNITWSGLTERLDNSTPLYGGDWHSAADLNVSSSSTPLTITATLPTNFDSNSAAAGAVLSFNPVASGTTLTAAAGSYALTGSAAALALRHTAGAGSYALTGSAAAFAYKQTAGAGSYTLTGSPAAFLTATTLTAAGGSYTLTGSDATFQVGGNFTLFCGSGSYTLTGSDVSFPGYDPVPPVQPSTGGGYTGGAVYDTYRLRRKRKRDEIEELIDAVIAQPAQQIPQIPQPPPPALVDLMPKMEAVGLTPPQRKIVKRAIVSDDPDDDDEAIELLLNLLS